MKERFEFLSDVVYQALKEFSKNSNGVFIPHAGHNGPYSDIESPVRNASHWLTSTSILYAETGDSTFLDAATGLIAFLLQPGDYAKDNILIHRQKGGKDWCNGVIGQAWGIEALAISGKLLSRNEAIVKATEFADAFRFSTRAGAWVKKDPSNGRDGIDYTLNHQLWYAAALSLLDSDRYDNEITIFLDALHAGAMKVRDDGRIHHLFHIKTTKGLAFQLYYRFHDFKSKARIDEKEDGYHLYNLFALARLKYRFGQHPLFKSTALHRAVQYAFSKRFLSRLKENKYSYSYNSPAFEFPLIASSFKRSFPVDVWTTQIDKTYNPGQSAFYNNCPDPLTLNARIYEWFLNVYYEKYS